MLTQCLRVFFCFFEAISAQTIQASLLSILIVLQTYSPKATKRVIRVDPPAISKPSSYDNDSILPNVGEDDKATPPIRPNSWIQSEPHGSLEHKKNSGNSGYKNDGQNLHQHTGHVAALFGRKDSPVTSSTRPEVSSKRLSSSTAPRETDPSNEPLNVKDPEYDRRISASNDNKLSRNAAGPGKRLFDPQLDDPNYNSSPARRTKNIGFNPGERRSFDGLASKRPPLVEPDSQQVTTPTVGNSPQPGLIQIGPTFPQSMKSERKSLDPRADLGPSRETELESQPELLLQPETRPISHDQLVVEVKGIYAGLVLVEAKCMDVDKKQSRAALERDPALKSKLNDEQWQALIALHKTLLHEHHDFFLASQHPSANEALSQLAERYTMPARMWRHGIHAFLEVLRHRLPDSLEHMLAFIYIAYSMIALLYETVTTFEDTWIECLGDLGRYRMAIEDDDPRDREVWGGVARFWYGKAADKCPNIGRLYHHLAILARPFSLQQLALYAKALTCVIPFGSARSSIKTLFKPVVDGKESSKHRSNSFEVVFIKAHYFLFDFNREKFVEQIKVITGGLLDQYIGRATAKFKEQGVFAAITNIAALLEYGICTEKTTPRSPIRRAFEEAEEQLQRGEAETSNTADLALDVNSPPPQPFFSSTRSVITPIQRKSSIDVILLASQITFETFSIALKRIGDKNVYPLVHVMFVFVWSLTDVPEAMEYVESDIPWGEMCSFLNALDLAEFVTKKVWAKHFPEPDNSGDHEVGRPLPEDFLLRGLMFTIRYFPQKWFANAMVDDEERNLELPSMAAPRLERILWLAARIASVSCFDYVCFSVSHLL